ncbi:MAG: hypothetical protein R2754_14035 [Microthrixaceae bacterium]
MSWPVERREAWCAALESDYLLMSPVDVSRALVGLYAEAWAAAANLGGDRLEVLAGFDAMALMGLHPARYTHLRRLGMPHALIWEAFCCRPHDVEPSVAFDLYESVFRSLAAAEGQLEHVLSDDVVVAEVCWRIARECFVEVVTWMEGPWTNRRALLREVQRMVRPGTFEVVS